jgi:hypothetical protein
MPSRFDVFCLAVSTGVSPECHRSIRCLGDGGTPDFLEVAGLFLVLFFL